MGAVGKLVKRILPAALVAVMGFTILWRATDSLGAFTAEAARRLKVDRHPVQISDVKLTDFAGHQLSLLNGKVTLVEFIYTTCPTICQSAGDDFFRLRKQLQVSGKTDQIQMLSVSFDPERDDNDKLATYAELHGADGHIWTVARPAKSVLTDFLRSFGVTIIPDELGGFQHNTAIHILDRDGHLVAIFDADDIEKAADKAESLL